MDHLTVCVDLDGTLVHRDTLWMAFTALLRRSPWRAFLALTTIPRGKARFKESVAMSGLLDPVTLPYRKDLIEWLWIKRSTGCRLVLATGADRRVAESVATHLMLFDDILSSDGTINLTGPRKAAAIQNHLDGAPFVYVGDSDDDMAVWAHAEAAIVIEPSARRMDMLQAAGIQVAKVFGRP